MVGGENLKQEIICTFENSTRVYLQYFDKSGTISLTACSVVFILISEDKSIKKPSLFNIFYPSRNQNKGSLKGIPLFR